LAVFFGAALRRIRQRAGTALNPNKFLIKDLVTEIDAFIAVLDPGPGDNLRHLLLGLAQNEHLPDSVELAIRRRLRAKGKAAAKAAGECRSRRWQR